MKSNIWNEPTSTTSYLIRQRTQAQKAHLKRLTTIKSRLIQIKKQKKQKLQKDKQPFVRKNGNNMHLQQKQCQASILQKSMVTKPSSKSKQWSTSSYVHNLQFALSMSRLRQSKQIQKQNDRMFQRIIQAKASLSSNEIKKRIQAQQKYKKNILKQKNFNPDYTLRAKDMRKTSASFLLKPIQNLQPLISKQKLNKHSSSYCRFNRSSQQNSFDRRSQLQQQTNDKS